MLRKRWSTRRIILIPSEMLKKRIQQAGVGEYPRNIAFRDKKNPKYCKENFQIVLYLNTANPNVPHSNCTILKQNQGGKKHTSLGTNSSNPLTDSKTKLFILRFFLFLPDLVNCQNPFCVVLKGARCLSSLAKASFS